MICEEFLENDMSKNDKLTSIYDEDGMLSDEKAEKVMVLSGVKPDVAALVFRVLKMRRNGEALKKISNNIGCTVGRVAQLEAKALKIKRRSHVFYELSERSRNGILIYYTNENKMNWPSSCDAAQITVEPSEVLSMINRGILNEESNHVGVKSMNQIKEWIKRHCA